MLIEFTVGNFKSFKGRQTFSLAAAPLHSDPPILDKINVIPVNGKLSLLKTAAIYGANASGKSNLGVALRRMRTFIFNSTVEVEWGLDAEDFPFEPFLLSEETEHIPCYFEIIFLIKNRQYRYGFEINSHDEDFHIVSEWLFHVPRTKEVALFVREGQTIRVEDGFEEGKQIAKIRPEALFLSVVRQFDGKISTDVINWFRQFNITTVLTDSPLRLQTLEMLRDEVGRQKVEALISLFDTGIDGLDVEETVVFMPSERREQNIPRKRQEIMAYHSVYDEEGRSGSQRAFKLNVHESQGTRKLISMAGLILTVLDKGQVCFIDELEARLHPLITRRLVELFHNPVTNPDGAQLIFATHDTNLLDRNLFRRDQIWFMEKDTYGATHLYSLLEFRPRNDVSLEKNYLAGRYGALPYLGDVTRLPKVIEAEEAAVA